MSNLADEAIPNLKHREEEEKHIKALRGGGRWEGGMGNKLRGWKNNSEQKQSKQNITNMEKFFFRFYRNCM